jgi:hypothetical protein
MAWEDGIARILSAPSRSHFSGEQYARAAASAKGSNTAGEHITMARLALAQLPTRARRPSNHVTGTLGEQ